MKLVEFARHAAKTGISHMPFKDADDQRILSHWWFFEGSQVRPPAPPDFAFPLYMEGTQGSWTAAAAI